MTFSNYKGKNNYADLTVASTHGNAVCDEGSCWLLASLPAVRCCSAINKCRGGWTLGPETVSARNWRIQSRVRIGANALDKSELLLSHCTSVTYVEIMRSDVKYLNYCAIYLD